MISICTFNNLWQNDGCFAQSILNSLTAHIAVVDDNGVIIAVNQAWKRFADQNGNHDHSYGVGRNYLMICDAAIGEDAVEACRVSQAIRQVLDGAIPEFVMEYPCHSEQHQRWYQLRITRLQQPGPAHAVIYHENITDRVLAEQAMRQQRDEVIRLESILLAVKRLQAAMNDPLQTLTLNVSLLGSRLQLSDPSLERYIMRLRDASERISTALYEAGRRKNSERYRQDQDQSDPVR